jgi:cytochrome c oxidase cbb3-type subunit 3
VWHEVDGIIEHDNKLPNWWLFTLFGAIVFAILYWIAVETAGFVPGLRDTYRADYQAHVERQAAAAANRPLDDATLLAAAKDEGAVVRGKAAFMGTCAACHGQEGEGVVGPNLTDNAWIHGGSPMAIYGVIAEGALQKGMPAWKATLGDAGVKDVVAYVLTLKGKNLPGKAPQGNVEP